VYLPKSVDKIVILDERDDVLGCHKMKIALKAGESPLEGGETKHICCYPIDQILQGQSRVFHGSERTKASAEGGEAEGGAAAEDEEETDVKENARKSNINL
jgi:hypothetical protein